MNSKANRYRYLARHLLHSVGVHMRVSYNEMHRVLKVEGPKSLTDKEQEFLRRTLKEYDDVCNRLSKFTEHLHRTLP